MFVNSKVSQKQLEDAILKATGKPVVVDVPEDSDLDASSKMEQIAQ